MFENRIRVSASNSNCSTAIDHYQHTPKENADIYHPEDPDNYVSQWVAYDWIAGGPKYRNIEFTWNKVDMPAESGENFARALNLKIIKAFNLKSSELLGSKASYKKESSQVFIEAKVAFTTGTCPKTLGNPYNDGFTDICNNTA